RSKGGKPNRTARRRRDSTERRLNSEHCKVDEAVGAASGDRTRGRRRTTRFSPDDIVRDGAEL
ncbi:MAG: hypothetical protein IJ387_06315, partial [Thermoguttaceae bacterium]|nr:hypothetical protein [Thermoguttaceae bacterium]